MTERIDDGFAHPQMHLAPEKHSQFGFRHPTCSSVNHPFPISIKRVALLLSPIFRKGEQDPMPTSSVQNKREDFPTRYPCACLKIGGRSPASHSMSPSTPKRQGEKLLLSRISPLTNPNRSRLNIKIATTPSGNSTVISNARQTRKPRLPHWPSRAPK